MDDIIDIQKYARDKTKEAEKQPTEDVDNGRVYEVKYKNNEVQQAAGTLMLTGAFFAIGTPFADGSGVDFVWSSPIEEVHSVTALDDDDLTED